MATQAASEDLYPERWKVLVLLGWVLKAFEEKKNKAPLWWVRLLVGLFSVTLGILAVISCFFLKSPEGMTYL